MELYKSKMDKIGKYLIYTEFCNWDEPFLNKNIAKMIKNRNSNFSFYKLKC